MAFSFKMVAYDSTSSDEDDSTVDEQQIRPSSPLIKKPRNALESSPPDSSADQYEVDGDPPVAETEETEQQHEQAHASPQEDEEPQQELTHRASSRRKPYALSDEELPVAMLEFLKAVADFFTRPVNLARQKNPVLKSTFQKVQERTKCYLGFLRNELQIQLRPEVFLRVSLIEQYLDYLREERQCSPATIANHCSSLLYPAKFLNREQAPHYREVPVIKQLRAQASIFQKEGEIERPRTKEELKVLNRWLDWEEIVDACGRQRDYFEIAVNKREKAKECCDLVILALYVFIPPGRGLEIRTLEIDHNWQEFNPRNVRGQNILLVKDTEQVTLHFDSYKTVRYSGHQEITLKGDHELCRIILDFLTNYRQALVTAKSGNTLLLNRNGERFTSASFSSHVKHIFHKLTGVAVNINSLRSAFVTWTYGKQNVTDSLKSSLAAALRHSRNQAEKIYDRRTLNERKEEAVSLAREFAEESFSGPAPSGGENTQEPNGPEESQSLSDSHDGLKPGQFVGLAEEDSTLKKPKVLIAQVHRLLPNGKVSLLWYKPHKNLFKLELDGQSWIEDVDCLVPVNMEPANNKPGWFRLGITVREIHKTIHGGD